MKTPKSSGKLITSIVIGPQGATESVTATVVPPTLAPEVAACVVNVIKQWKWPAPEKSTVVTYPFGFAVAASADAGQP